MGIERGDRREERDERDRMGEGRSRLGFGTNKMVWWIFFACFKF